MDSGTDWLCEILQNVQLEQFYLPIRDQLQVTRLAHFDYVHASDLERIGISKPGVRRLLDAVRKKKLQLWNRKFWNKLFGSSHSSGKDKSDIPINTNVQAETNATCIVLEKDLALFNELGCGSFGVVRRGEWKLSEHKVIPVAVKVLKEDAFSKPGVYDDFRREVEAMHSMNHPNLIKLHGVVFHPLMMVCELAHMGALLDYIRAQNSKISLHYISKWSGQVASGMAHLEKHRFLHRDLACRNILLSSLEMVKIGDFGLMRALPDADDCYVMSERRRVPFPWCAPESLRTRTFSHASDVWMFAVALWEMYTFGEEPWIGLNGSEILRLIMREGQRLSAPAACPPDVYMLMMQCWDLNPKERPTFDGIQRYMETNKFETAVSALSYRKQGQMTIEAGDAIILIDKRPELHWWKGQNQRTLELGLFPSSLIPVNKNKSGQVLKKTPKASPARRGSPPLTLSPLAGNGSISDDSSVILRKRRTIESTQPITTRAGNSGSKHFNYNKLINDSLRLGKERAARDAHSKSLNQVREDLLIDLDLPPSTRLSTPTRKPAITNSLSLLDEPIDVPEMSWDQPATESLPSLGANSLNVQSMTNLYGAKSMDNLTMNGSFPQSFSPDPFDTTQFWPTHNTSTSQPNYDVQLDSNASINWSSQNNLSSKPNYDIQPDSNTSHNESQIYSNNDITNIYTQALSKTNSINPNNSYGTLPLQSSYATTNALSTDINSANTESNVTRTLAEMSLDDRISQSLNLRLNSSNNDSIYSNNSIYNKGASTSTDICKENRYNDIPIYNNFEDNTAQQPFILETKDFYTKLSTPSVANTSNYDRNIYVPKVDEGEKLMNFSESVENSKNYSAFKYQNVEFADNSHSSNDRASYSRNYDDWEWGETSSNVYSEIGDVNVYGASSVARSQNNSQIVRTEEPVYGNLASGLQSAQSSQGRYSQVGRNMQGGNSNLDVYGSSALYDEVYESAGPRPHRPAPPCPSKHK